MNIVRRETRGNKIRYGYYDETEYFVFHNDNGPAVILPDGTQFWYNHDGLHREDGPAVIYPDGEIRWFINDTPITYEVTQWLKDHNIDDWKTMTDEEKLALGFFMRSY